MDIYSTISLVILIILVVIFCICAIEGRPEKEEPEKEEVEKNEVQKEELEKEDSENKASENEDPVNNESVEQESLDAILLKELLKQEDKRGIDEESVHRKKNRPSDNDFTYSNNINYWGSFSFEHENKAALRQLHSSEIRVCKRCGWIDPPEGHTCICTDDTGIIDRKNVSELIYQGYIDSEYDRTYEENLEYENI